MEKRGDTMLDLTDEQKRLFYTGGNFKDYVFDFPEIGLKITNDIIHQEAVTIKQSICDEQELKLGGCIASSIEFEVSEIMQHDLTGLEFSATLYVNLKENGTYDLKIPMGVYRVDSCKLVDDKDYKKVVAYDALYDASVDVSDWYRGILPSDDSKIKLKEMRESLLENLGISYIKQMLANDDIFIEKTIEPSDGSMTGTSVLKLICELSGGFGKINREGLFEVVNVHGLGLFPEEDLYPEETLYPEDHFLYLGASDDNSYPEYRETKYEEYMCPAPTCVTIKSTDDEYGTTSGEDLRNPYLISGNYLLYGKKFEELKQIAWNILKKIDFITYRPNNTKLWGLPYMETGDVFALEKRRDDIESYIFSRTLTGVQGLWDTYEAKGSKIRDNKISSNAEIIQLKGKSLELKKSIDGVSSELTDFEKQTSSKFEQTDEKISAEVKSREDGDSELSGRIDVTAGQVVLKADANGNIVAVELTADPKDGTIFKVEADNISLSANEAIEFLSGGTLNLTGQKIKIESDNFSVDENGNATVNSIDILGGSINIGDKFVVDENGICSQLEGDFTIQAKNLDLTAEEAISLMAGGTLNLSGKDINIESDNFSVDENGKIEAKSIEITGGKINIETVNDSTDHNIILKKLIGNVVDSNGNEVNIDLFGEKSIESIVIKDDWPYEDSGKVYMYVTTRDVAKIYRTPGTHTRAEYINHSKKNEIKYYETSMRTDEGMYVAYRRSRSAINDRDVNNGGSVMIEPTKINIKKFFKNPDDTEDEFNISTFRIRDSDKGTNSVGMLVDKPIKTTEIRFGDDEVEPSGYNATLGIKDDCLRSEIPVSTPAVNTDQIIIGGKKLVAGSAVISYSGSSVFVMSAPNISGEMPVTACNGDISAQPAMYISSAYPVSGQGLGFVVGGASIGNMRINYSYWENIGG